MQWSERLLETFGKTNFCEGGYYQSIETKEKIWINIAIIKINPKDNFPIVMRVFLMSGNGNQEGLIGIKIIDDPHSEIYLNSLIDILTSFDKPSISQIVRCFK